MRDINRIETFLNEVGDIWKNRFPDWRFGQLMYNFISCYGDPFYLEEDEFLVAFKAYANGEDPRKAVNAYRTEKVQKKKMKELFEDV